MNNELIYKILPRGEWEAAEAVGRFRGSGIDLQDGYIHLSTRQQVEETAERYFRGQRDLLLLAVAAERLGDSLRYEPSRHGQLFPHVYGDIPVEAVTRVHPLELNDDETVRFPEEY